MSSTALSHSVSPALKGGERGAKCQLTTAFFDLSRLAYSLRILNSSDPAQAAELAQQKVKACVPRFEEAGFMELVVRFLPRPTLSPLLNSLI